MLTIHERVLNELYFDVAIPRDRLKVKFQNDWVILSGEVDWPYQRSCAEADARRVPGVMGSRMKFQSIGAHCSHA